jgi:hypothetical protein
MLAIKSQVLREEAVETLGASMKRPVAWALPLAGLLSSVAVAQSTAFFDPPTAEKRKHFSTDQTTESIDIDGQLNEEVWKSVGSSDFVQVEPQQGSQPKLKSTVWMTFDDSTLYVAARLEQPGGFFSFQQRDLRRDYFMNESDSFSVILDTLGDGRNAFSFGVNPFGAQLDMQVVDGDRFERNWDTLWRSATTRDEQGWTVEIAIPFKSLRSAPNVKWGVQFARRARKSNEDTVWSPIPRAVSFWRMAYAGVIDGLSVKPSGLLSAQFRPYAVARLQKTGDDSLAFAPTAGGEVTWTPNSSTTIDLTGNTDFAETDVDQRVVNLSRFSVFFPERRQFFLESAGLFTVGDEGSVQPFFSRRIGLSGGKVQTVTVGSRAVIRSESQSFGAYVVHTLGDATQSGSLFGVARYSRNVGAQSSVGGLATFRSDFLTGDVNIVPAIDALYRSGSLTVSGTLMGSVTQEKQVNTLGVASVARLSLDESWGGFQLGFRQVSPDFKARSGFVNRENFYSLYSSAYLDVRPKWFPSWLRGFQPGVDANIFFAANDGTFLESFFSVAPVKLLLAGGDEVGVFIDTSSQHLSEAFAPVNNVEIAPGDYTASLGGLFFGTTASRKVSAGGFVGTGKYFAATQHAAQLNASVQPIPQVRISGNYRYNYFSGKGVMGQFTETHLISLETRLALSPKLQLAASYQRDSDGNTSILNARFSWEFLPLSFLYIVVTDTRSVISYREGPVPEIKAVAKLTYTFRL